MAKLQIIENERGERALVKKAWGFTWYRLICLDEWNPFPHWYNHTNTSFRDMDEEFEKLLECSKRKPSKSCKVLRESKCP